jgi:hypothetical protein
MWQREWFLALGLWIFRPEPETTGAHGPGQIIFPTVSLTVAACLVSLTNAEMPFNPSNDT